MDTDRALFCGDKATIADSISWADVYGHPTEHKKPKILQHDVNLNLCDINWSESWIMQYSWNGTQN